jgi:hypothetical protein
LIGARFVGFLTVFFLGTAFSDMQSRRDIEVVLDARQSEPLGRQTGQASSAVVIRRGPVNPLGEIIANQRRTKVQRSSGRFALVLVGGASIALAARIHLTVPATPEELWLDG